MGRHADPGRTSDEGVITDPMRLLALAGLDHMTPARLLALTDGRPVAEAWDEVRTGQVGAGPAAALLEGRAARVAEVWRGALADLDPVELWARHVEAGVEVVVRAGDRYPEAFALDPHPPVVVFARGDLDALDGPRVAVVGTRDCTRYGRDVAFELGHDLASAGVRVVSGLALGIDSAAHAGALEASAAPAVGVVGSGLDVVYPRRNASLWRAVGQRGVLLSEHPLGRAPAAWHFPARNRLIAALADIVVVVESHERGGALHTAEHAADRDVPVMAVPGSARSRASDGSNRLFELGAQVCLGATDVLALLGLDDGARRRGHDPRPSPTVPDQAVLDAIGWEPTGLESLLVRTGLSLGALTLALDRLEADGWVDRRGGWVERRAAS